MNTKKHPFEIATGKIILNNFSAVMMSRNNFYSLRKNLIVHDNIDEETRRQLKIYALTDREIRQKQK